MVYRMETTSGVIFLHQGKNFAFFYLYNIYGDAWGQLRIYFNSTQLIFYSW